MVTMSRITSLLRARSSICRLKAFRCSVTHLVLRDIVASFCKCCALDISESSIALTSSLSSASWEVTVMVLPELASLEATRALGLDESELATTEASSTLFRAVFLRMPKARLKKPVLSFVSTGIFAIFTCQTSSMNDKWSYLCQFGQSDLGILENSVSYDQVRH